MAGPGIRYSGLASALSRQADVVLAASFPSDTALAGVEFVHVPAGEHATLTRLALDCDAVVAQRLPLTTALRLAAAPVRVLYDLYAPTIVESVVGAPVRSDTAGATTRKTISAALDLALATGDAFLCATERQRDFWLGALLRAGRLTREAVTADPTLRDLVDVVPFGVDPEPPSRGEPVLKGVWPGIGTADRVLLWPGGIWDWTDPLVVIRAATALAEHRDDIRLVFLGTRSPNPAVRRSRMIDEAVALAARLDSRGRTVFFNEGWTPYAERGRYLLEADIGVSAHPDTIEARLAYRSRLLDCIWSRLPIVTSGGDVLAELVAARGLGRVVDPGAEQGWIDALSSLLDGSGPERAALDAVAHELSWARAAEPILRLAVGESRGRPRLSTGPAAARYLWHRVLAERGTGRDEPPDGK
jgi:hypothetical protein